ncbi:hypothetical protein D3C72_1220460 [compost metagenome]
MVRRRDQRERVEHRHLALAAAAVAVGGAVVQHQVAVAVAAGGRRHVAQDGARRVDAVGPDHLAGLVAVHADGREADEIVDRPFTVRDADAVLAPCAPRRGPVAQRGGRDAQVPQRAFVARLALHGAGVGLQRRGPVAAVLVDEPGVVPGRRPVRMDGAGLRIGGQGAVLVAGLVAFAAEFVEGGGLAGFAESDGHGGARERRGRERGRGNAQKRLLWAAAKSRVRRAGKPVPPLAHCRSPLPLR